VRAFSRADCRDNISSLIVTQLSSMTVLLCNGARARATFLLATFVFGCGGQRDPSWQLTPGKASMGATVTATPRERNCNDLQGNAPKCATFKIKRSSPSCREYGLQEATFADGSASCRSGIYHIPTPRVPNSIKSLSVNYSDL
jgi:hypothetical protein